MPRGTKNLPTATGDCPDVVRQAWNEMAAACGLLRATLLTKPRRRTAERRLADPSWRAGWRAALARIPRTPALLPGACGLGCDLDFFLRSDTVDAILEGRFDWRGAGAFRSGRVVESVR